MTSLLNSRWQNCKEFPNMSTNNEDMAEIAKHPMSDERSRASNIVYGGLKRKNTTMKQKIK